MCAHTLFLCSVNTILPNRKPHLGGKACNPWDWRMLIIEEIFERHGPWSAGTRGCSDLNALERPNLEHTLVGRGRGTECKTRKDLTIRVDEGDT